MTKHNHDLTRTTMDIRAMLDMRTRSDDYYQRYEVRRTIHTNRLTERLFYIEDTRTNKKYAIKIQDLGRY